MKRLFAYLRPFAGRMSVGLTIKIAGTLVELALPYILGMILNEIIVRYADSGDTEGGLRSILIWGGIMAVCAVAALVFNIVANRMSAVSSGKITRAVRHDLFRKLQSLSARQMDGLTVSSAESRLTSDTYNVNQLLARLQRIGIRAPILLIGGIFMMLAMDHVLALVLIGLLPVIALVTWLVTRTSIPLYTRQQSVLDRVVRTVQENITGIRLIKALSRSDHERRRFNSVNEELTRVDMKAGFITTVTNPVASLTLNLGLTLVVVIGAYRVHSGSIRSGVIVAFLQYFTMILNAMLGITRIFVMWSKGEASAKRVAEVLAMEEDLTVIPGGEAETDAPHIEFRDVSFSYMGIGKNIDSLSFRLERGQTLGILGPTGSGKSTIVNLLMRLYDPDEGAVLIGGRDVRSMEPRELRSRFGVVFQNDFVAEGTVADNIRFFRDLPEEDL
ncbi:MAG: ABC transporter ATP-binding protein, partial [Clostridia bacterium]|nr:ABC transporter ATP-binding protein [Clostridia bacterium]